MGHPSDAPAHQDPAGHPAHPAGRRRARHARRPEPPGRRRPARSEQPGRGARPAGPLAVPERSATLVAEGEAISLYPRSSPRSSATTRCRCARGPVRSPTCRAPASPSPTPTAASSRAGTRLTRAVDDLSTKLAGLRLALAGQEVSGVETGDELGLALARLRARAAGRPERADRRRGDDRRPARRALPGAPAGGDGDRASSCAWTQRRYLTPARPPTVWLRRATSRWPRLKGSPPPASRSMCPLPEVERGQADAQRGLWLVSLLVLILGAIAAWFLARSLTRPLAHLTGASQRIAGGAFDQPVKLPRATRSARWRCVRADAAARRRDDRALARRARRAGCRARLDRRRHPDGRPTAAKTVVANHVWTDSSAARASQPPRP